jgi:hemerythrin-like metal-binding protein
LRKVTQRHFQVEETIMRNAGYPAMAGHYRQHEDLLADFDSFAAGFYKTRDESTAHAIRFLQQWFEYHVQIWDQPLVTWLDQRPDV